MFDTNVATPGRAIAGFAGMTPVASDGILATVRLRLAAGAGGEVPLVLEKVEAWAADDQRAIEVATTDGVLALSRRGLPLGLLAGAGAVALLLLVLLVVLLASRRRSSASAAPRAGNIASRAPRAPFSPSAPYVPASPPRPPDPTLLAALPAVRILTGSRFGQLVPIPATTRVGRGPECEVVLDDPLVSRVHFSIEHGASGWVLSDHGSGNGTFVNGYRVTLPVLVGEGDEISAGDSRLRLEGLTPLEASPAVMPPIKGGQGAPAFCSQCGQRLAGDARFCSRCGRSVA
jgi:hypothetical protein